MNDQKVSSINYLKDLLQPGDEVKTVLSHVSRSGMTRWIRVLVVNDGGEIEDVSWHVAKATGYPVNTRNHSGVEVGGCGMDMGFHLVYGLSRELFRDGFLCTGLSDWHRGCPSNDHSNERTPNYAPGRKHSDPGYALRHRWL